MKRFALILAAFLILAVPATAATPKQVVKAQKVTIAKLKAQLAKAKQGSAQAQTDLATRTRERDSFKQSLDLVSGNLAAQTTLTTQAATGALAGLSPDQLWDVIGALYPLLPNSSLCGYGRSVYASGGYTSYSFTRYLCIA